MWNAMLMQIGLMIFGIKHHIPVSVISRSCNKQRCITVSSTEA